ncbi:MAG: glycosyltransferase family 2 protein [Symploca sp. SIO3C6]|uniref:Glycosyltransferase family 2 protein n=1 Tax=Symploca sp. SIO1C4 TaxID=2607765 RepID=A0A6B3N0S8_9CYAN|nr:glycosyltransferase family 2 protein [Symploca sp. SIO3C6]NER27266.1 glycosyltransferase family 2 protein [Symploca sp. SIO1C4]
MSISVIIPFYRRHYNLKFCLQGLNAQRSSCFDVIVSAFEVDSQLEQICNPYPFVRIEAMSGIQWSVARSRNTGIRAATGEVLLFLDADILAQPNLVELHRAVQIESKLSCMVPGRVLNFFPYKQSSGLYTEIIEESNISDLLFDAENRLPSDERWGLPKPIPLPWSLCWSGNLSIPRKTVLDNELYFNETFIGWGCEDLEWSYRAYQTGCQVKFCREAWGIHLPHSRHIKQQITSEKKNFRKFLQNYPTFEVEILTWLNDIEANRSFLDILLDISKVRGLSIYDAQKSLMMGFLPNRLRLGIDKLEPDEKALFLLGIVTPFEKNTFDEVIVPNWIERLPTYLRLPIQIEMNRICKKELI